MGCHYDSYPQCYFDDTIGPLSCFQGGAYTVTIIQYELGAHQETVERPW